MKRQLLCVILLCVSAGMALANGAGVVAYRGKVNYKVFTGLEKLNGKVDLIILRDATDLDGNEYFLVIDKQRKIFWAYAASSAIDTWQESGLDFLDTWPTIYFELNGNDTEIQLEVGGYGKRKTVETYYEPPAGAVVKTTTVDVFKSMPVKGVSWTLTSIAAADTDDRDGMGWTTGSVRYNKKLTQELNTDEEILGNINFAWSALRDAYVDEGYEDYFD